MSGVAYTPPLSQDDITAIINAKVPALIPTQFAGGGNYMPVATLMSSYPASFDLLGKYARVSDAWGGVKTIMVCEGEGSTYYWRPQRADYATPNTGAGGSMTLTPLLNAPIQVLTGSLTSNLTLTPSTTNVWPGCTFTIVNKGVLGLFGINITGLTGGALGLLAGAQRTIYYTTANGWQGA